MFSTGLGHEMPAVLAIIAAFMAGMALGAWALDRFIPRSARAGRWLGGIELTIGAWVVLVSFLIPSANDFALRLIGIAPGGFQHWLIAFTIPGLLLLPATAAMGATLPAMEKFLSALAPRNESIGGVYAANTFGAVAGTLLTPFVLMPALGFGKTCWALAVVNITAALGAAILGRSAGSDARANSPATKPRRHEHADSAVRAPLSARRLTLTLFCTGLLGITYEAAGVRVLSRVLEGTVFTYAAVLAVFLLGTAAGAAAFHRWWRQRDPARTLAVLLYSTGMAGMTGLFALMTSGWLYQQIRPWGDSTGAVLAAELLIAASVFALPSFGMGALFSHLAQLARQRTGGIGRVLAVNTLGAALAPVLLVALLPVLGAKWLLFATAFGYFLLHLPARPPALGLPFLLLFLLSVAAGVATRLRLVDMPPGGRILSYREGIMASVAVLADTNDQRTLRVDNRYQMGGTAAADAEYRQAHLPLLLHPAPERALFLGVGTGISLGAAALYPGLRADAVELVPEVAAAMPLFAEKNFSVHQKTNFAVHVADARRFVRTADRHYDVIVADLFHPYRDGAGALYTREHFATVRARLATNGLFCQWLPLHQLDEPTLRVIVCTFQDVFPEAEAWLLRFKVDVPVLALVGWRGERRWMAGAVETRLSDVTLEAELKRLALADSLRVFGHLLSDAEDLRRFARPAKVSLDDDQRVTFLAPRAAYQHAAKPYASLLALLEESRTQSISTVLPPGREPSATNVLRYLAARNIYLRGLVHDTEQRRDEAVQAYIESARVSPDFTTGYAQALSMASVLAGSDPARARRILEGLIEAQPERPVARDVLRRLFP